MSSLAVKYRPTTFDDVVEQSAIKIILTQQIKSGNIQHAYLFCGGAGTGKTTCARIFANEINHHQGVPIELDAASNNGVDDVREIIKQAQSKSLDSEYKIFIVDECHSISSAGWQAFLKLLEEPPAKSIFIFCTTDPQKIPKTILSRVQRYDFQRISQQGIVDRLKKILSLEFDGTFGCMYCKQKHWDQSVEAYCCDVHGYYADKKVCPDIDKSFNFSNDAIEYIAKIADGGMRDAISLMDKCLAYSKELTLENVIRALGTVDYSEMFGLFDAILQKQSSTIIKIISDIYYSGKDLKLFMKQFTQFVLDVSVYTITGTTEYLQIPDMYKEKLDAYLYVEGIRSLLSVLVKLNSEMRWETSPKALIEATLILEVSK